MEHRAARRFPRRLNAHFGEVEPSQAGFTQNVSETGLFITTSRLPALGLTLAIRLRANGSTCHVRGQVVRHVLVPMELRSVKPQGFGVRFLGDPPDLREVLEAPAAEAANPTMRWLTRADYLRSAQAELERGGLTFTTRTAVPLNETLEVALEGGWRSGSLMVRGRVVHCRPDGQGFVAIILVERPAVALAWLDTA